MTNKSHNLDSFSNLFNSASDQQYQDSSIIYGSDDGEDIYCNNSSNIAYGQGGEDVIYGSAADDYLYGGFGTDVIYGSAGNDHIYGDFAESLEGDDDFIYGAMGDDIIDGGGGNDEIYGEEGNDLITGGRGEDFIDGGKGDDRIDGGDDNDFLRGAKGADILIGNNGHDHFEYPSLLESTRSEPDLILDFTRGEDKIDISGFGFHSIAEGEEIHQNHQLEYYYNDLDQTIIIDPNSDLMIKLTGHIELNNSDFIF
jgi:Ca2+-binding RTX toxin-like protein